MNFFERLRRRKPVKRLRANDRIHRRVVQRYMLGRTTPGVDARDTGGSVHLTSPAPAPRRSRSRPSPAAGAKTCPYLQQDPAPSCHCLAQDPGSAMLLFQADNPGARQRRQPHPPEILRPPRDECWSRFAGVEAVVCRVRHSLFAAGARLAVRSTPMRVRPPDVRDIGQLARSTSGDGL